MRQTLIKYFFITTGLVSTFSVMAEEILDPIFVTATRTPQAVSNALAATTVLTRKDIESSQANSLPELLSGLPGIDISINGGYGKTASINIRGTNNNHTLILIDGASIGSATTGSTAFQHIPLYLVKQIEIVRGPRSSLYGSKAIGGVINIITRKGSDKTTADLMAGYGTYNTSEINAGISGSTGNAELSLHARFFETDGINALTTSNSDNDGYLNRSFNASFMDTVSEKLEFDIRIFHTQSENDFDGFDPNEINLGTSTQNIVNSNIQIFPTDNWDSSIQISSSRDESNIYTDGIFDSEFDTSRTQLSWQNDIHLSNNNTATFGYDYIDVSVDSTSTFTQNSRNNKAIFLEFQNSYSSQDIIVSIRQENNEAFFHHKTGNIDWRYKINNTYSVSAAYGEAFKTPTFNDLFFPFTDYGFFNYVGNPGLSPEESNSVELGLIAKPTHWNWELRLYKTEITNLISIKDDFSTVVNIGKAAIKGLEASVSTNISGWNMGVNLDFLDPVNKDTGKTLRRRASHLGRLTASKDFGEYSFSTSLSAQGSRYDDNDNTKKLSGFGLMDIRGAYKLNKEIEIKAKIDNLFDKEYQTTKDYNSLGRVMFVSVQYSIK